MTPAARKPPGVEYTPIVCRACVDERRAQRTWLHQMALIFVCPIHGSVLTLQALEGQFRTWP